MTRIARYTIKERHIKIFLRYYFVCYKCGKPLHIGDKIVTRKGTQPTRKKHYHIPCYDKIINNNPASKYMKKP